MKKFVGVLVISVLIMPSVFAASDTFKNLGNEIKATNKAILNKNVDSAKADNEAKIRQYQDMQKQEHDKYQASIKAKKAELAEVKKNNSDMTQQQKAAKEAALQKQIDELNKKDAAARENYNKKIETLKI